MTSDNCTLIIGLASNCNAQANMEAAVAALKAMGLEDKRVTLIISDNDVNTFLSFRNIPGIRILGASEANTYDLIDNASVVLTSAALKHVEEVLA